MQERERIAAHRFNIAVLLTGHMRTWGGCHDSVTENVFLPLEAAGHRATVFLVTWPELSNAGKAGRIKADVGRILRAYGGNGSRDAIVHILEYTLAGKTSTSLEKVFCLVQYAMQLVFEENTTFSAVLKMRPDIIFYSPFPSSLLKQLNEAQTIIVPSDPDAHEVQGSRERRKMAGLRTTLPKNRVQDHIALGSMETMRAYSGFGFWLKAHRELADEKAVEILLGEYLHRIGVGIRVSCEINYGPVKGLSNQPAVLWNVKSQIIALLCC